MAVNTYRLLKFTLTVFISVISLNSSRCMTFDNRFIPLYQKQYTKFADYLSHLIVQPFASTADSAFNDIGDPTSITSFNGTYDMVKIDKALQLSGKTSGSLFRSDWQGLSTIPWDLSGLLETQGVAFLYHQSLGHHLALGISALFMHVGFHQHFKREVAGVQTSLPLQQEGDENELLALKQQMNNLIGVKPPEFSDFGFGDVDIYLRAGDRFDYLLKMRSIDVGGRIGILVPTGNRIDINNPASVPFGGNGFWGMYGAIDAEFELKRDLKLGALLRLNKRFTKTIQSRFPVLFEPTNYGINVGPLKIDPGFTFIIAPYFRLDGLREGLGLMVGYTFVKHQKDDITDSRCDKSVNAALACVYKRSSWVMENVTLEFRYDFGRFRECRGLLPIVSLAWDIPTSFFATPKRTPRTNFVSLLIESCF